MATTQGHELGAHGHARAKTTARVLISINPRS